MEADKGIEGRSDRLASVGEVSLEAGGFGRESLRRCSSGGRAEADLSEGWEDGVDAHEEQTGAQQLDQF